MSQRVPNPDRLLEMALRRDLRFFLEKVVNTLSPSQPYQHNWHIDAILHHLEQLMNGRCQRLVINQPPRSLKSICVSIALPAFILGHHPDRRIIVVSYSNDLAAELHRLFRLIVESDWYKAAFPNARFSKITANEAITSQNGGRIATSVGGTLTGKGAHYIIIDDPLNAADAQSDVKRKGVLDWFTGTLLSRLDNKKKGCIVLVMQRLHEEDLAGHVLEDPTWTRLILSAIAIEDEIIPLRRGRVHHRKAGEPLHSAREDLATLERTKRESGSLLFSGQYQQTPIPLEGNLFRRAWFKFYTPQTLPKGGLIVQSWDVAAGVNASNDYSVCTTWRKVNGKHYLLDVLRERLSYPDLRRRLLLEADRYKPNAILIEEANSGMALLQDLHADHSLRIIRPIAIKPERSKEDRAAAQSAKIEAGMVFLPQQADWLAAFLNECLGFPTSKHDDQVDSMCQYLLWDQERSAVRMPVIGPPGHYGRGEEFPDYPVRSPLDDPIPRWLRDF